MRNSINCLLALFSILLFASCKNSGTDARYIPKNAAVVVHLNGKTLTEKLPWEEIQKNEAYKMVYADSSLKGYVKDVLDNPEVTGVDIANNVFIFMEADSAGSYVAVHGRLKDAEKFSAFLKKSPENTVGKNGDLNTLKNRASAGVWNKDRFLMVLESPDTKSSPFPLPDEMSDVAPGNSTQDLAARAFKIFGIKEKESLAEERKFTKLLGEKGDMHFWMNTYALYSNTPQFSAMNMMNLTKIYEGSFLAATATFEKGQVLGEFRSYSGKELTDIIKKYSGKGIDKDMVNKLNSDNLAALYFANFKPEGVKAMLDLMGMTGLANIGLAMAGITIDDVVKGFKGDFLFAVNNITKDSTTSDANFTFAASVNDKDAFNKLLRAFDKMNGAGSEQKLYKETKGDLFALSNKQTGLTGYMNASPKTIAVWDKLSGSAVGGYANFQYIMKNIPLNQMDSGKTALYNLNLAMWQDAYLTGGKFKNGAYEHRFEINMVDKNTNSLKQLNDFFSKLAEIEKKNKTLTEGFESLQEAQKNKMDDEMGEPDSDISLDTIQ